MTRRTYFYVQLFPGGAGGELVAACTNDVRFMPGGVDLLSHLTNLSMRCPAADS